MAVRDRRWYVSLDVLKDELGETGTSNDAKLKRYIERASSHIERETGRTFYPVTATKYFDVPPDATTLYLAHEDLLTLTTLTDNTGTITSTYYWLYPLNLSPKHTVLVNVTDLGRSFEWDDDPNRAITVVGVWGYSQEYEDTGYTLSGAISSTTATTFTASAAGVEIGWCLLVDTEQMFVSGVTGRTVTVQRGVNGTTAATHADAATVYRYVPPMDIEQATLTMAASLNNTSAAGGIQSERIEGYQVTYGGDGLDNVPGYVQSVINRYRRLAP